MYESGKIMGDVHKNVPSSIEKCKDVLPEEQQHHRNSEPRRGEAELHIPDPTELGIEDYVVLQAVKNIYGYIVAICIQKFEEALKGVTK